MIIVSPLQIYNVIGFSSYSVFNAVMYWSSEIQEEYRQQNNGHNNQVQLSDVFFPIHGVAITFLIVAQIYFYDRGGQKVSFFCKIASSIMIFGIFYYLFLTLFLDTSSDAFSWLGFVNFLADIKLAVTCIKYFPQCYLNYSRKSTVGSNIDNFILDFVGGSLSVGQLIMDAELTNDWSAVTGDIAKFILGSLSMIFDTIFFFQHFVLYTNREDPALKRQYVAVPTNDTDRE
jgi:cystinosin